MASSTNQAYAAWPTRLYLVDTDGKVAYAGRTVFRTERYRKPSRTVLACKVGLQSSTGRLSVAAEMNPKQRTKRSKFLSYILRHEPQSVGLCLDERGWAFVSELLEKCGQHGKPITMVELREIVQTSPKRRFAFSEDETMIRASQGHSIDVDLGYAPQEPPETLFHGTGSKLVPVIREQGLKRMARHHVHLSSDRETASAVGQRQGKPVILEVAAGAMAQAGYQLYLSANGVWLVDEVPPEYLRFPES